MGTGSLDALVTVFKDCFLAASFGRKAVGAPPPHPPQRSTTSPLHKEPFECTLAGMDTMLMGVCLPRSWKHYENGNDLENYAEKSRQPFIIYRTKGNIGL